MAKETAEQKLLKILEASGKVPSSAPKPGGASAKTVSSQRKFRFSVQMLNGVLLIGILVCLVVLGLELQSGNQLLSKRVDFDISSVAGRSAQVYELKPRDIAFYAQKIGIRNIFKPFEKEQMDKVGVTAKPNLAKKLSKYKLVGVAWLDLPESASVMVEDTTSGMTYFLREGEKLDDVTIKTIYTDRAVFGYENEEITIKL
jgi:hypothetical protein